MPNAPHFDDDIEQVLEQDEIDLSGLDLSEADLSEADLSEADLSWANLRRADLSEANLTGTDLTWANLSWVNLTGADLTGADVGDADLSWANLTNIKYNNLVPKSGSFTAYKATQNNVLKIEISTDAERVNPIGSDKCRAEKVRTLEILDENGESCDETKAHGWRDENTVYQEGEITKADSFDESLNKECTHGIHFFMEKKQAIEWFSKG